MLYHIEWAPRLSMNGAGFCVRLYPEWKVRFMKSGIDEQWIISLIKRLGPAYLESNGYNTNIYGSEAIRFSFDPEWGVRSITVPGNGCGLDLTSSGMPPKDGMLLVPHNVDGLRQASLLLTVFSKIAGTIVSQIEYENLKNE